MVDHPRLKVFNITIYFPSSWGMIYYLWLHPLLIFCKTFQGTYMIVFHQSLANMLYNSVITQSLLIWTMSVLMGGFTAAVSFALSCFSALLMWICSLSFSTAVAFILPLTSSSPVPFVSSPWLVAGLFVMPAVLGALTGQHIGYLSLKTYLLHVFSKRKANLSPEVQADWAKLEAERWLYKSGLVQWLILLMAGHYYKVGSSYLALIWLVSPAFACKFILKQLSLEINVWRK